MPPAVKKLNPPKKKPAKRATSFAQLKLGDEPQLLMADKLDLVRAFNWYNTFASDDQRLGWLLEHMRSEPAVYSPQELKQIEQRGRKLSATYAYLARLLQRGTALDDAHRDRLRNGIKEFLATQDIELDDEGMPIVVKKAPPKRHAPNYDALAPVVAQIEEQFEMLLAGKDPIDSCFDLIQKAGVTASQASELKVHFARTATEFQELHDGDEQLEEGYGYPSARRVRKACSWLQQLLLDLQKVGQIKRGVRKQVVRKRKPTPAAKQVARVKFQQDSKEFKLVSFPPEKLVGAKTLFVFNTKYRLLTIYEASDPEKGLEVKGTTLHGFDASKSVTKKIRAPEQVLPTILGSTRLSGRTTFNNLKTKEAPASGRINSDTILLKVYG